MRPPAQSYLDEQRHVELVAPGLQPSHHPGYAPGFFPSPHHVQHHHPSPYDGGRGRDCCCFRAGRFVLATFLSILCIISTIVFFVLLGASAQEGHVVRPSEFGHHIHASSLRNYMPPRPEPQGFHWDGGRPHNQHASFSRFAESYDDNESYDSYDSYGVLQDSDDGFTEDNLDYDQKLPDDYDDTDENSSWGTGDSYDGSSYDRENIIVDHRQEHEDPEQISDQNTEDQRSATRVHMQAVAAARQRAAAAAKDKAAAVDARAAPAAGTRRWPPSRAGPPFGRETLG